MSGTDDERFAEIVAGYEKAPEQPVSPWPVSEDVGADSATPPDVVVPLPSEAEPIDGLPGWLEPEALADEGHYVPPPAPKIPRLRPRTLGCVATMLLGFAVLFMPYRIGLDDSTGSLLLGLALTSGGAALLVSGMRDAPPTGSGPDDGAVV